ncbi:hypothetical protein Maqu_1509 [Marinobacter nauticus VT8]|uniref:Phage integrase central domain-containing protein n=1 Tax=Marinobacter nauticus (strain ATCC 700491 / DSM 11845 / VT8) TaxID=351348 RepID=A1U0S4_MARN8|nr:hypothetical protein Maqu_1509 [Marinobacter nauticus VT8]
MLYAEKTRQASPQNSSVNETGAQNGITSTWQHPITGIEPPLVLRKIQAQGKYETAHRIKQRISQVSRFAISDGSAERDPAADLRGHLKSMPAKSEFP